MPKLPGVNHKDAVRVFQKLGFKIARESAHIVMSNGEIRLTIPRHNPINALTMGAIAKDAGLNDLAISSLPLGSSRRGGPPHLPSFFIVTACAILATFIGLVGFRIAMPHLIARMGG